MTLKDWLLPEFDHEMAITRRLLERVPDAAFDWKPHDKAFGLGSLATHIAVLPHWGLAILNHDKHDMPGTNGQSTPARATRADVLDLFDRHVAEVRRGLVNCNDADLAAPWTLTQSGRVVMSMPRASAFRSFLLSHVIHHRGQLSIYLRMQNVPLPPIYGPSADETM
ncbi:MAG TPA: DinB family protein [Vicinamibacterales bacterium]|nr:DinB family protein [Vicinamibacterales bacterium]